MRKASSLLIHMVALARNPFEDPSFAHQVCSEIFLFGSGRDNCNALLIEVEV